MFRYRSSFRSAKSTQKSSSFESVWPLEGITPKREQRACEFKRWDFDKSSSHTATPKVRTIWKARSSVAAGLTMHGPAHAPETAV